MKEKQSEHIGFMATPTERWAIERMAADEERNVSSMLRKLVRDGAKERNIWPSFVEAEEASDVAKTLQG